MRRSGENAALGSSAGTIKDVVDGKFKGGNVDYGLDRRGVGLGKVSPDVPKKLVTKVDAIRQQIVDGKIANIPTTVP